MRGHLLPSAAFHSVQRCVGGMGHVQVWEGGKTKYRRLAEIRIVCNHRGKPNAIGDAPSFTHGADEGASGMREVNHR